MYPLNASAMNRFSGGKRGEGKWGCTDCGVVVVEREVEKGVGDVRFGGHGFHETCNFST